MRPSSSQLLGFQQTEMSSCCWFPRKNSWNNIKHEEATCRKCIFQLQELFLWKEESTDILLLQQKVGDCLPPSSYTTSDLHFLVVGRKTQIGLGSAHRQSCRSWCKQDCHLVAIYGRCTSGLKARLFANDFSSSSRSNISSSSSSSANGGFGGCSGSSGGRGGRGGRDSTFEMPSMYIWLIGGRVLNAVEKETGRSYFIGCPK